MKTSEGTRIALTRRDTRVMRLVWRFGLLSRDQLMLLGPFRSVTRVNTRLATLVRADMLRRKMLPVYPGQGSAQALYFIGKRSAMLSEVPIEAATAQLRRISRWRLGEVEHQLAANGVLVNFIAALEGAPESRLITFRTETELRRIFLQQRLVPDGWLAWTAAGKRFDCFLEIDLHNEGLTVWRKKILDYLQYAESGQHQELFGFRAFRVLTLAKNKKRLENLRSTATQAGQLFLFAELNAVNVQNLTSKVWLPAASSCPLGLSEA